MTYWAETKKVWEQNNSEDFYKRISLKDFRKIKEERPSIKIRYDNDQHLSVNEKHEFYLHFISKGMLQRKEEKLLDTYRAGECVKLKGVDVTVMPYNRKPVTLEIIVK